jgi:hypothetical protein
MIIGCKNSTGLKAIKESTVTYPGTKIGNTQKHKPKQAAIFWLDVVVRLAIRGQQLDGEKYCNFIFPA